MDKDEEPLLLNTYLDAEGLKAAFSNNWMKAMYSEGKVITGKVLIIGLIVVFVFIIIILQASGKIDIKSMLGI